MLASQPVYGSGRIGVLDNTTGIIDYEITDHVGNVRATIKATGSTGEYQLTTRTDYYAFGGAQPGRTYNLNSYRFNYQGQESAVNSKWQAFDLRMHNSDLGRWFAPDPYGQFHSPYVSMGNNPINGTDPDGGYYNGGTATTWNYNAWTFNGRSYVNDANFVNAFINRNNGKGSYDTWLGVSSDRLGPDLDDTFKNTISAFGAIGSGAFSDVDAPRSATEARANAELAGVMGRDYNDTYDVSYYANQEDYNNKLNGTNLGNHETLDDAFAIWGAFSDVMGHIQSGSDITAGRGGSAFTPHGFFFKNETTAYKFMVAVANKLDREAKASIFSDGVLVNPLAMATRGEAQSDFYEHKIMNGSKNIFYNNTWNEVIGDVHTHPTNGGWSNADYKYAKGLMGAPSLYIRSDNGDWSDHIRGIAWQVGAKGYYTIPNLSNWSRNDLLNGNLKLIPWLLNYQR